MTFEGEKDSLLRALAHLPAVAPDEGRAARVRSRCHAALAARERRGARTIRARRWVRAAAPGLIGVFCVVYLAAVIDKAIEFTFP